MKTLFILDPLAKLKPLGDTSLSILHEAFLRKWNISITTEFETDFLTQDLVFKTQKVLQSEAFKIPQLQEKSEKWSVKDFDLVFIRKDPPFDSSYLKLCWLLSPFEEKIRMVNRPSLLLRYHEKMLPLEGLQKGYLLEKDIIPTCITSSFESALEFAKKIGADQYVIKPWLGFGGSSVFLIPANEFEKTREKFFSKTETWIVQPFDPEVQNSGDRRAFFFKGKYAGSVARIPKKGSIVANLAQGGSAEARPMTSAEEELTHRLEKWIEKTGIDLAGADYIHAKVNEVNITSPTVFVSYEKLYKESLSKRFLDEVVLAKTK